MTSRGRILQETGIAHETIRPSTPSRVVVVGAGPAGAATALLLARSGIAVTLIERETDFHRVFRGEGLMPTVIIHHVWLAEAVGE